MSSFPFYHQLDACDCGPTCLRMIAKYCGRQYSASDIRERCHITKGGVSLLGISDAAESMGFHSVGVTITWEQLKEEVNLPCIVHWKQNHFIVVYGIKKRWGSIRILVADPANGLIVYPEKGPFCAYSDCECEFLCSQ